MNPTRRPASARPQRGAALLMAMVIVTVVATIASSMVWQQWRAVQVESAERGREQSEWLLVGALDFARMVLIDAGRQINTSGGTLPTHLGQQWAQDLKEMRLSTFLAVDKDNTDDAPDAFLSGKVVDLSSRYNLRTLLVMSGPTADVSPQQLEVLRNLFKYINVPPTLADQIAEALKKATLAALDTTQSFTALGGATGRAAAPLMPQRLDQLPWLVPQMGQDMVERMRPYVTLLPFVNGPQGGLVQSNLNININTAPKEVIAAVWGVDPSVGERVVRGRQNKSYESASEVQALAPMVTMPGELTVESSYFEVTGVLRLEDQIMKNRHVVQRQGQGKQTTVIVMSKEQFSGLDPLK